MLGRGNELVGQLLFTWQIDDDDDDDGSKLKYHKNGLKLCKNSEETQESQRIEKVKTDFNRVKFKNIGTTFFPVFLNLHESDIN